MRANPGVIFVIIWIGPLIAPLIINNALISPFSNQTNVLVIASIAFMLLIVLFFWAMRMGGHVEVSAVLQSQIDYRKFEVITWRLFCLWLFTYFIHAAHSGGVPLYWAIAGIDRTYVDFGVPTLGGFSNMLRAFVLVACFVIVNFSPGTKRFRYLGIAIFLLFSAFLIETGRGNGVVLILHPIGMYLLCFKLTARRVLIGATLLSVLLIGLGGIQIIRYREGFELLLQYAESQGFESVSTYQLLLIPSLIYYLVPLANVDLNLASAPLFSFEPYYSLQGLVPTVIRNFIFEARDYGVLVNEANNVTSFYTPFVRDFGVYGGFLAISFLLFLTALVYSNALRGKLFSIMLWPALFMSLTLSVFSLFYTSLVVVLYPFLTYWVVRRIRIHPA